MKSYFQLLTGCLIVLATVDECSAQRLTVQQPVISRFGVQTTISVPDRGTALLGSVSRQGFSRYSTGPFRSGSSVGRFSEHQGASVSVYIHDFEELERQLLASSPVGQQTPQRLNVRTSERLPSRLTRHGAAPAESVSGISIGPTADTNASARLNNVRSTTAASAEKTSIADTAYGRARMSRRRNLERALYRVRSYR